MSVQTRTICKNILFDDTGKILLIRRSATDTKRPLEWDFPGGNVEAGEDMLDACVREIDEEVGIRMNSVKIALFFTLTTFTQYDSHLTNINWLFFTTHTDSNEVALSFEHDQFRWLGLKTARNLVVFEPFVKALDHLINIS